MLYIYFIQADNNLIKIGITNNLRTRIRTLCNQNACKLSLLGVIECDSFENERALHDKFAKHRLHGEWFSPNEEILEYIDNIDYNIKDLDDMMTYLYETSHQSILYGNLDFSTKTSFRYIIYDFIRDNDSVSTVDILKKFNICNSDLRPHINRFKRLKLVSQNDDVISITSKIPTIGGARTRREEY
jgi:T5orf172 domain.